MAILKNRYKDRTQMILRVALSIPEFVKKFLSIILLIFSIQILCFGNNNTSIINNIALECSSYPIDLVMRCYNNITELITDISDYIRDLNDLRRENISLKLELKRLTEVASHVEFLRSENDHLRKELKISSDIKYTNIPARVISISTSPYGMSAILQVGSDSGVENGLVVVSDSAIVGRIVEVGKIYSRMALVNDFSSRIPVISSVSGVRAIVAGRNDNNPLLLYLLDEASVKKGEVLISSGDGKSFPAGFKVARVKNVEDNAVTTNLEFSLSTLRYVNIILPTK